MNNYASDIYEIAAHLHDREGEITRITRVMGVDFGRSIEIIRKIGNYAVAKRNGHLTFDRIGKQRWESTSYFLLNIWTNKEGQLLFRILETRKPGYKYRAAITDLTLAMKRLVS